MTVGLPPPEDRSFADVWSALGGELKPSLDLVVSVPTDTGQRREVGPPVLEPPRVSLGGPAGGPGGAAPRVVAPPRVSRGGAAGWPPREQRHRQGAAATGLRAQDTAA